MGQVIGISDFNYRSYRRTFQNGVYNGAHYYADELERNIVPLIKTDRHWDLLGMRFTRHFNHSIVFIHHNLNFDKVYKWIEKYRDVVLVVSSKETYRVVKNAGYNVIYLPLSVDVEYVKKFRTEKTKEACYAGNKWRFKLNDIARFVPDTVDYPEKDLPREKLLEFIAPYRVCYSIGRCAIEARVLGCEIRKCDSRYDPEDFQILDNKDAAEILQTELNKIDGVLK